MNEQENADQSRMEATRRYVKGLEEFKAQAMATVLDATYAALAAPAKTTREEILAAQKQIPYATLADVPAAKHATEDDDDQDDDREVASEPHYAGDDENLTSEELNQE